MGISEVTRASGQWSIRLGNHWKLEGYAPAKHERLLLWFEAIAAGILRPGSVLVHLDRHLSLRVDDEHTTIPRALFDLPHLALETARGIRAQGMNGIWEKFDYDDGFDPDEEHITPAIATGLVGKYIWVNMPGDERYSKGVPKKGQIALLVQKSTGSLSYLPSRSVPLPGGGSTSILTVVYGDEETIPEADRGPSFQLVAIPFERISAEEFLRTFRREDGKTYILNGQPSDVPAPFTYENFRAHVMPAFWG